MGRRNTIIALIQGEGVEMLQAILFRDCRQTISSIGVIVTLSLYAIIGYAIELTAVVMSLYNLFFIFYLCALWSFGNAGGLTELIKSDRNSGIYSLLHQINGGFLQYFLGKMILPAIVTAIECAVMWMMYIPYGLKNGLQFQDIVLSVIVAECMTVSITALSLLVVSFSGEKLLPILAVAELVLLTIIVVIAVSAVFAAVVLTLAFVCSVLLSLVLYVRRHYICTLK